MLSNDGIPKKIKRIVLFFSLENRVYFAALFILHILFSLVYHFYTYKYYFNSDSSIKNAYAQAVREYGSLFPKEFSQPNGDLLIFGPSVLVLFFSFFLSDQYTLHAIAASVFSTILFLLLYNFGRRLTFSLQQSTIAVVLFSSILNLGVSEFLIGQSAYSFPFVLVVLQITLAMSLYDRLRSGSSLKGISLLYFCVVFVSVVSNPTRASISFVIPCLLIGLHLQYVSRKSLGRFPALFYFSYFGISVLIAALFRLYINSKTTNINGAIGYGFHGFESSFVGISRVYDGLVWISGSSPGSGYSIFSFGGVAAFIRFVVFLVFIKFVLDFVKGKVKLFKNEFKNIVIIILGPYSVVSTYTILFSGIMTDFSAIRYIMVPLLVMFFLFVLNNLCSFSWKSIVVLFLLFASTLVSYKQWVVPPKFSDYAANEKVIDFLEQRQIDEIGGTFWNSKKFMVLSSNKLDVYTVALNTNDCIVADRWLNNERFNSFHGDKILLILNDSELATLNGSKCSYRLEFLTGIGHYNLAWYKGNW